MFVSENENIDFLVGLQQLKKIDIHEYLKAKDMILIYHCM